MTFRLTRSLAIVLASSLLSRTAIGQPDSARAATPGSELTISLITMGNGRYVWEFFGHNAFWIHDARAGTDRVYNWGVFDMRAPHFIPRFLRGTMMYRVDTLSLRETMLEYRYWNRSVVAQELNLTPAEREELRTFVDRNMRPENQFYRYEYFRDNCSTRVRDVLDRILRGQLGAASKTRMSGTTYRWHTLRLMQVDKLLVTGVDIGMSRPGDVELSAWEEMFLPRKLHDFVATFQVRDSSGATRPLVRSERVLFQSTRGPEPDTAPRLFPPLLFLGCVTAGVFAWLGVAARRGHRGARIAAAVAFGLWSLAAGVLGLILTAMWTVTDHTFAYKNENLFLFNPIWLVQVVALPLFVLRGQSATARRVALILAGVSVLALVLHVVMLSAQANWAIIALALPPALALAWVTARTMRR